jgi:hypothetical protein
MVENKHRSERGRFAKKSAAGGDAGGINGKPVIPIEPAAGEGERTSSQALRLASADRPGLTDVHETPEQLQREALNAAASVPPEMDAAAEAASVPAPAGPTEEEVLAGYNMVCSEVISQGFGALAPAWRVQPPEVSKLSLACSRALMLWFPDMLIPPKYMALLVVAGVGFEIVQARRNPETGQLAPRHFPAEQKQPASTATQ